MSREVDEKVVSMQFENKNFESNARTSMNTIDKLEEKLNFKGITKGVDTLNDAVKKTDVSVIGKGIETVHAKFSALQVAGVTALANITNSAVNAGKRMVSALTIDPIKTGFQEYETQINSVQTILANTESKGSTLQDVNNALAELNTYADKTIYNFTEMTRNIGTFTAAGVDLDTSVSAIKGIANLAAVSGSTSQQASTAMYQLSQAMASGTVKLMDWNSVVNAGMGGQVFQDALKETARVHKINIDAMIKEEGSFRETLQKGWLTSEILTETLSKFTGDLSEKQLKAMGYTDEQIAGIVKMGKTANDAATKVKTFTQLFDTMKEAAQSGWTKTWEILIGDFGEAKDLLTEISDMAGGFLGAISDSRNELLGGALSTGWKQLLNEGITDAAGFEEQIRKTAKNSGVDMDKIFNSEKISEYGKALKKLSEDESNSAGYTQKHVTEFAKLEEQFRTGKMSMDEFTKSAKKHGINLEDIVIDEVTFQDTLKQGWMTTDVLSKSITEYGKKLKGMSEEQLEAAGYTMKDVEAFEALEKKLKDGSISLEEFTNLMSRKSGRELLIESLRNALKGIASVLAPVKEAFGDIFAPLESSQLYDMIQSFTDFTAKLTLNETQSENLKRTFKGLFAVVDIGVEAFKTIGRVVLDLIGYITPAGDGILGFTAKIGDLLVSLRNTIKEGNVFGKIVEGIGAFLKPVVEGIKTMGKSIADTFGELMGKVEIRFEPLTVMGNALKAIFVGIGKVIAKAMPLIVGLAKGIGNIFSSLMERITSSIQGADYNALFDILNGGIFSAIGIFIAKFIKSGTDAIDNAGGILENIKEIIGGVGDALDAFTQQLKAKTLKEIAIAIGILAASLFVISLIDSEKLIASLTAVATLFAELMGAMSIFGKLNDKGLTGVNKTSLALMAMASALFILAVALKIMGSMSWKEMGVGLITMAVALGAMIGVVWALPKEKELNDIAKAISSFAKSLVVMAIALKIMGSMSWKEMGVGLITMAVALGAMIGVVWALPKEKELAGASRAISSFARSLVVMAVALKIMGSMSWKEMGVGLITMAVALGAMIGVVWALPADVGAKALGIMGFAAAMVILASALKILGSMSWEEMIRGLAALVGALGLIIGVVWALEKAGNIIDTALSLMAISAALLVFSAALKSMGSMSWEEVIRGLAALTGVFVILGIAGHVLGPVVVTILILADAVALLGVGILAAGIGVTIFAAGLTALAAALAVSGGAIVTFVASIIGLIPFLIEQIGVGIIKLCEVIAGSAAAICEAVTVIVLALVDALVTSIPAIAEGALKLIVGLLEILIEYLPQIVPLLVDLFVKLIDLVIENLPSIAEATFRFLAALLDSIASNITQLVDPLVKLFGAIFQGIADVIGPIVQEVLAPILKVLADLFVGIFEVLEPHIPMICELIAYLATIITNAMVRIVEAIAPYIPELTEIVQIIADAVTKIIDDIVRLFEQISPILDSISNVISETGEAIEDALNGVSDVIDSIGGLIESFFDGISGVIDSVGEAALNAGKGFDDLANGVKTITKLNLVDMAASLAAVATGLGKIVKHSDGIADTGTGMKKIADSIETSGTSLEKMGAYISAFNDGLASIGPTATKAATALASSMTNLAASLAVSASNIKTSISGIAASITTATTSITASMTAMGTACANTINGLRGRIMSAGKYMMSGLAAGIQSGRPQVLNAARSVANSVESIIRSAWKVNSPSKLFYKIALGIGEGIEYALDDSASGVENSAQGLADSASTCLKKAITRISDIVNGDIDAQPTIRPVLDLSDVRAGADTIGGMFSGASLAVSANSVGAISASMSRSQNGRESHELLSAIKGLRKDFADMPRNNYNINGITYDDGSNVSDAIKTLVRAAKVERRV